MPKSRNSDGGGAVITASKFDNDEFDRWGLALKWCIVNLFTAGTISFGFVLLVIPNPISPIFGVPTTIEPLVLASLAVFCDIADGKLARLWKVQSKVGATFDGISDMMAFGIAPPTYFALKSHELGNSGFIVLFVTTTFIICAVYRIARFLVFTFQYYNYTFKGMPTNAAGCLAHLSMVCFGVTHWLQPWILLILSYFMISRIPFEKPGFLNFG